jgi:HAD superfamily hydrolase (TIGR01509 family)
MIPHRVLSWTPAAVVFDCDGTLMDTERHWQDARKQAMDQCGLSWASGIAERARGLHYTECGRLLASEAGRPDLETELTERLLATFRTLVSNNPTTMPGAPELVEATAKFAPLAVASNCPQEVVETCLETAGLRDYFDHIVVPGQRIRPKPYPDVYLTAAQLCGVHPTEALAVEDSACGIRSAAQARMRILGVGPWPGEEVMAMVDLWVHSLDEPHVTSWAGGRVPPPRR